MGGIGMIAKSDISLSSLSNLLIYQGANIMIGYYLTLMRKSSKKSSEYINQICSDIYESKQMCEQEAIRRSKRVEAKLVNEKEWVKLPIGAYFFYIAEIQIIPNNIN
jgi:hypothetical protein